MTEHSLWRFSRALHGAINDRQSKDLEELIDEEVDWAIYGPIDMFPFLGARRGKAAVIEVIRQIADNVRVHRFDRESIMLGVDSAASMLRYSLTALELQQADQPAARAFRPVQGRTAEQPSRRHRHLRPGRAGARASDPSAEDRVLASGRPGAGAPAQFGTTGHAGRGPIPARCRAGSAQPQAAAAAERPTFAHVAERRQPGAAGYGGGRRQMAAQIQAKPLAGPPFRSPSHSGE